MKRILLLLACCFALSACGGGSGSSSGGGSSGTPTVVDATNATSPTSPGPSSTPSSTSNATLKGTVTFPSSTSKLIPKFLEKLVAASIPATIQILDMNGNLIATADVTDGSASDTYTYTTSATISKDAIIQAVRGSQTLRAALDSSTYTSGASKDVDTSTTTAVVVLEQNMGITPGSLGTSSAPSSPAKLSAFSPATLEADIAKAIAAASSNASGFTSTMATYASMFEIVKGALKSNIDPAKYIAGTTTSTITMSIPAYSVSTSGAPVASTVAADKIQSTVTAITTSLKIVSSDNNVSSVSANIDKLAPSSATVTRSLSDL